MRIHTILGSFALATVLLPAQASNDTTQHTLTFKPVEWKVGDVATIGGRLGLEVAFAPDSANPDEQASLDVEDGWIAAVRADELNAQGHVTKGAAQFQGSFTQPNREEADYSVGGVLLDFANGRGTIKKKGMLAPTAEARHFVESKFPQELVPAANVEWIGAMQPPSAVAVGDKWKPDYTALAQLYSGLWDCELSGDGATGEVKLESLREMGGHPVAFVDAELELPMKTAPQDAKGRRAKVGKDAKLRISFRGHIGAGGRIPRIELTSSGKYWGSASIRNEGRLTLDLTAWWSVEHDGSVPEE